MSGSNTHRRPARRRHLFAVSVGLAIVASGCIRFEPAQQITASDAESDVASDVTLADVTGNGRADVLVEVPGAIVRLEYCGPGCLEVQQRVSGAAIGFTGDFDGDGVEDLLSGQTIYWGGPGTADRAEGIDPGDTTTINALLGAIWAVGDFDGDGQDDLVTGETVFTFNFGYRIALGDGTGSFTETDPLAGTALNLSSPMVLVGDIDGDGDDEALVTTLEGLTAIDPTGALFSDADIRRAGGIGDIDGDGRADIVRNPGNNAYVLFYRSTGDSFEAFPEFMEIPSNTPTQTTGVMIADLDNDGLGDALVRDDDPDTKFLGGSGDGGFPFPTLGEMPGDNRLRERHLGDVNGDGLLDIVVPTGAPFAEIEFYENTAFNPSID